MATAFLASVDGLVGPAAEARIPVTDEGLVRGDGVFEVLRLYAGRPFALEDHLARLERSATNLRLPLDLAPVRAEIAALLAAAGNDDGLLRIIVTRGGHRILTTEELTVAAPTIRLGTVTYAPTRLLDGIKSLSYAPNMLATRLAREQGADEALLVTPHGRVLEAPTSSIFWVAGGRLRTPPLEDHVLASITRGRVMELAEADERPGTLEEVFAADEAFLASTTREIQPIAAVDGRELPLGGPVTADLALRLHERILSELP